MLRKPLPISLLLLGLAAGPLSATEQATLPQREAVQPARETQADNAPLPAPDAARAATAKAEEPEAPKAPETTPAKAEEPDAPKAAEPAPGAVDQAVLPGFGREFADALATEGKEPAQAERDDRSALSAFYAARQNEPVWTTAGGLTPKGEAIVAEFKRAADWGLDPEAFALTMPDRTAGAEWTRAEQASAEIALGLAILKYARHARGGRTEPVRLSRYFDRKPQLADPRRVMDEIAVAAEPDAYLRTLHPRHPQFEALRQKYLEARRGEETAGSAGEAGKADKKAAAEAASLARRLLVNMEQWRWMPEDLGDFHVAVNIPEYTLRVVRNGRVIHSEKVIVGKANTQTPIFSDEMEQVIFHPFWGVPDSIKKNEILPSLARGSTRILERHNLRIQHRGRDVDAASIDWTTTDIRQFHVYQPPGRDNVLGVVKFRFPNKHDVYMHDTPTKNLFNTSVRAFSHGCVRVRDPLRLAELLLAEDKDWPAGRIAAAVESGPRNNHVNLTQRIPVHMTYFTASVDDEGKLRLVKDIYGHETRIGLGIDGKAHLIRREKEDSEPVRAQPVARLSGPRSRYGGEEWIRRAFGE